MGHQWRLSKRSVARKERIKAKKFAKLSEDPDEEMFLEDVADDETAIIVDGNHGKFRLFYNDEILSDVKLSRSLDFKYSRLLVPGDHVSLEQKDSEYCISGIQQRTSKLSRTRRDNTRNYTNLAEYEHVIAANIDAAVIVVSANNPPLHPRLIDRYLIMIQSSNLEPIICMNKADLAQGNEESILESYKALGVKYVKTSTVNKEGIDALKELISDKMTVFIGHSGVGKSSLLNAISGNIIAKEGEVSGKTGKGKHTTTSSILYKWDKNSYVIDTPGIR
jgi:ribosome biogenesis GTPase